MEIWKDIEGYEGLYQVSNEGRVKSLERTVESVSHGKPCIRHIKGYMRAFNINPINGYLEVSLNKEGTKKTYNVHRLVAEAFIPNPDNKPCIDHINTIKDDNRVENLRWCTQKENLNNPLSMVNKVNSLRGKFDGDKNPMFGRHHSEETRKKISDVLRRIAAEKRAKKEKEIKSL